MSRVIDVLGVLQRARSACEAHTGRTVYVGGAECFKRISDNYGLPEAIEAIAEVFAAAHASLAARDLADQMAADEWLERALAACEPETPHEPV
ncbi:TPA: hypothetical protein ACGCGS_000363 [Stenotrophomonas maltophilia]